MAWSGRDFLRASATVGAASAFDLENLGSVEAQAQAVVVDRWQKAPCLAIANGMAHVHVSLDDGLQPA